MTETKKIQVKRGLKEVLPTLAEGEFGYATDTEELFIGDEDKGNIQLATTSVTDDLSQELHDKSDMNKGYIALKGDTGVTYQGIESWDGTNKNTKLYIAKDRLQFFDYNSSTTPFQVLLDGTLSTAKGTLGTFFSNTITVTDLNAITQSGLYWILGTGANVPSDTSSWGILHIQVNSTNAMQIAFPFHATLNNLMMRRTNTGMNDWYAWRQI